MTRAQLLALGVHRLAIHHRLTTGRFYPTSFQGVYSVGCPPITPHERAMAAVLACGAGAVLSHGSALTLWGIWKRWEVPFDVTVRLDRRPKGLRVHRNRLHDGEITCHLDIPVTTLARALFDQAPFMPLKSLNRAINNGRQSGYLQLSHLMEVVERNPRHPGKGPVSYCLAVASDRPSRSDFEADFPAFCARYGLPQPKTNVTVCGLEVDVLFIKEKVIVELDGWDFHSSRFAFETDRERDAILAAAGYLVIRLTMERLKVQPEREASRLQAILDRRRE